MAYCLVCGSDRHDTANHPKPSISERLGLSKKDKEKSDKDKDKDKDK